MHRRDFLVACAAGTLASSADAQNQRAPMAVAPGALQIDLDLLRDIGPLPHYWENTIGSDRLAVAFREQWLKDLGKVHELTGMRSVRCHGLFDDEMGICPEVNDAGPVTSFVYLDQVYDRMLELGVRPFVELGFMPTALASSRNAIFWYRGNASPPKNMRHWTQLLEAFARHVIKRYGIAEVSQWRFECWNEPNLSFWAGTQAQYWQFYQHTATTLKQVDQRLQVGGPATAQMMWIPDFLDFCAKNNAPVDFVTSHIYADDPQENIFGKANLYPFEEVIPRALARANSQIKASQFPDIPLVITEWTSQNPAFIAQTIRDCLGLAETFAYWTFDSIFEERGPPRTFFNDTFGLIGQSGVPRPSLHAFTLLHQLGERRIATSKGPVLASRRKDGTSAVLVWNTIPQRGGHNTGDPFATYQSESLTTGTARQLILNCKGAAPPTASVTMLDPATASALPAFERMGRPDYPSSDQIEMLKRSAVMPPATTSTIVNGKIHLDLPPNSVALIELPG